MPTLALALMKKKHPDMKGPADEPPAPEADMDIPAEAPPSDEAIACAHDLMQAVKAGDAVGVCHAIQDLMGEMKGGEEEPPEAPGEPPEAEPPAAEE
jgi:hypothetical protein